MKIVLEALLPSLRRHIDAVADTHSDIEVSEIVRNYLFCMSEAAAWEAAIKLVPEKLTNAERFVDMILWLNAHNQSVSFGHDYLMSDPKTVFCNDFRFSSDTHYGALAKCVLYKQFCVEVAGIERKNPPKQWDQLREYQHDFRSGSRLF
jgi:hypothetical protein